jgi:hypothetical protein
MENVSFWIVFTSTSSRFPIPMMQSLLAVLCVATITAIVAARSPLASIRDSSGPSKSKTTRGGTNFGPLQHRSKTGSLESISLSANVGIRGFRTFLDEHGRERIFHGANAVVKGPPWMPATDKFNENTSLVAEDFALLKSLGVNVIRLGVMWPGVEPERGVYNRTYLAAVKDLAAQAAQYGMYTLVDMHQDVVSASETRQHQQDHRQMKILCATSFRKEWFFSFFAPY